MIFRTKNFYISLMNMYQMHFAGDLHQKAKSLLLDHISLIIIN